MLKAFFGTLFGLLISVPFSHAQEPLQVGMNAPASIVAEFVTGNWAERGTSCPVLAHRDEMKVAVFVKRMSDPAQQLVGAMEEVVADDAALKRSFVFVSHENAPTPTQEEWDAQIAQLKKLAVDKEIKSLSFGVMIRIIDDGQHTRAKRKLGFFGDGDVVVMLICPDAKAKRGVIRYLSVLKSEDIDTTEIERITSQLKDAIAIAKG